MANASAIQQLLHTPVTNYHLQPLNKSHTKKPILTILKNFLEKCQENGPVGRKKKTERATGVGRRTREEIVKGNQIATPRLQTGGDISLSSGFAHTKNHPSLIDKDKTLADSDTATYNTD